MITKFNKRTSAAAEPTTSPLNANYDYKEVESRVREFYDRVNLRKLVEGTLSKKGKKSIGWIEGPPTLNNQPHVGHVRGRIIKDLYYRYSALKGESVVFRGGWDTQGLPVELQAEKELGLTGNKWENLNQVGVERLVQACKELITKYKKSWEDADHLLGLQLDKENAYMTYRDSYIEREWRYLETAWKRGVLGEGYKVVPYCPSCQTSLSQAELALGGYEMLDDPSIFYKVKAEDGSYFTVWTTMPFTVVTDEFIGVKPDADYEYVDVAGETWIVASERKQPLEDELHVGFGRTVKKVKGRELEGLKYAHPLLDRIPGLAKLAREGRIHRVVAEDFVDTTTGTGLVHISPANGEDDFGVAQRKGLPVFAPLDDEVKFTPEAGVFQGLFVRDADKLVESLLGETGALVHAGTIRHEYPVCWRSGHRLVWFARREYFYWVDKIRDDIVAAAEKVEYFFEGPRNRFLEFLSESPPWCITRERVWGAPLPIWVCEDCSEKVPAFSREGIVRMAEQLPDGPNFELHRPWIDRVTLKCPKCGGTARREPFVLDTWHNSGAAPYASLSDEEYARLIPARFLTEGIDQTRGWAYTLLVLNVLKSGKPNPPYASFLFQGHVLDEQGRKMSKSLGNVVWGLDLLTNSSVDLARFYLTWKSSPEESLSLDTKEMNARPYQVLNTLYHLHVYLVQNGRLDGYLPQEHTLSWARERKLLTDVDEWLLCKMASAEVAVVRAYDAARYNEACKAFEEMVIGQVSQNYVRLVRGELWKDDPDERERRLAIYGVLGTVLEKVDLLLHPVAPFVTEHLYQCTFAKQAAWSSPLLLDGLGPSLGRPRRASEKVVEFALEVEAASNSARTRARLKRRWPLKSLMVLVGSDEKSRLARRALPLLRSLCNVRDVEVVLSPERFPAEFQLVPNTAKVGALFKAKTRDVLRELKPMLGTAALKAHQASEAVKLEKLEEEVPLSAFDFKVTSRTGFEVSEKGGVFVALDTHRDEKLVAEGLARDLARRLQRLRKERGFVPTALLGVARVAGLDEEEMELLQPLRDELSFMVRVREFKLLKERDEGVVWTEDDLDGKPIYLDVA